MDKEVKKTLSEIVESEGKCMKPSRCKHCPIRNQCFSRYYKAGKALLSAVERVTWAAAALFAHDILAEELDEKDIKERFDE